MIDPGALAAVITKQTVVAMKERDAERTGTLRLIKAALMNKALEKNAVLTPADEQQTLTMMIKQRRDSIEQFTKGNRPELAAKEAAEIVVIEEFCPRLSTRGPTRDGGRGRGGTRERHGPSGDAQGHGPCDQGRPGKVAASGRTSRGPHCE